MGSWCVRVSPGRKDLFYFQHRTKQGLIEMHRFIMNFPKGKYVDHINHNTLDNRKCNLRICNNADNIRNGKIRTNNKSGHTGVSLNKTKTKWEANIKVNYKSIYLGVYSNIEDAIKARKEAEKKYFYT